MGRAANVSAAVQAVTKSRRHYTPDTKTRGALMAGKPNHKGASSGTIKSGETLHHAVAAHRQRWLSGHLHALYSARHALFIPLTSSRPKRGRLASARWTIMDHLSLVFGKTVPECIAERSRQTLAMRRVAGWHRSGRRFYLRFGIRSAFGAQAELHGKPARLRTHHGFNQKTPKVWSCPLGDWCANAMSNAAFAPGNGSCPDLARRAGVWPILIVPETSISANSDFTLAGEAHRWDDYTVGEIDRPRGRVTVEEAEPHAAPPADADTAKVHFAPFARLTGSR